MRMLSVVLVVSVVAVLPACRSRCCPAPCAPAPRHTVAALQPVPYATTKLQLAGGDRITIHSLVGDRPTIQEGGTYIVRGEAQRAPGAPDANLMVWNADGDSTVLSEREVRIGQTSTPFAFHFRVEKLGAPHLSLYPIAGGESFSSHYFGPRP
jgi:hypothetical protein